MIRLLLSIPLVAGFAVAGLALSPSQNTTTVLPPKICPYAAAGFADGCSGRVPGIPQNPTLLLRYGAKRPPWNVAGVDYRIGHSGPLKDPSAAGALPSCASYSSGSQNTVTIDSAPCTIDHFDFTRNGGICLSITAPTNNAAVIVTNNNFKAGPGCQPLGGGLLNFGGSTIVNATIRYNTFEQSYNTQFSNIINMVASGGDRTIEYNAFYRGTQHIVVFGGSGNFTLRYNYAFGVGNWGNHGDWIILGSGAGSTYSLDEEFNTVIQDKGLSGPAVGATAFCYMAPWSGITFTNGKCSNNTYLSVIGDDGLGHVSVPIRVEQAGAGIWSPGPFDISNNYIDWSGSVFPITSTGTAPHTCSGNKDLTTGGGITGTFGFLVCN